MTEQKKSPEISIIVPVYQVEKYLNECIDSILAQTFTDFELILVDDGSPDNCPALPSVKKCFMLQCRLGRKWLCAIFCA